MAKFMNLILLPVWYDAMFNSTKYMNLILLPVWYDAMFKTDMFSLSFFLILYIYDFIYETIRIFIKR